MGEIETVENEKMGWIDLPRAVANLTPLPLTLFSLSYTTHKYTDGDVKSRLYVPTGLFNLFA